MKDAFARRLMEPIRGGDIEELFKFVPVETEEEKLLVTAWTIASLYPKRSSASRERRSLFARTSADLCSRSSGRQLEY